MPTAPASTRLIDLTGWAYFPIAFIARLPFSMMTVGVLTFVVSARDSVAIGGLATAATGIGIVIGGPLIGDLADRFGQRRVVLPAGILNGLLIGVFPLAVLSGVPTPLLLVLGVLLGLTAPQPAAMSRARLLSLTQTRVAPDRRERTVTRLMSYESAADELSFVIGPVLVGVFAVLLGPAAPLVVAGILSLVFVSAFALHPSAVAARAHARSAAERAPMRAVFSPSILILVAATTGIGLLFGTTMTSLTAFAQARGEEDLAGLVYGMMGAGSAVLALAVMALPRRFSLRARWITFSAVIAVAAAGYGMVTGLGSAALMIGLMGLGVGPTLVTIFTMAGERSPAGRSATTMTVVGSAAVLSQALASAGTGQLAEATSPETVMGLPVLAALLVVLLGIVNAVAERRRAALPAS